MSHIWLPNSNRRLHLLLAIGTVLNTPCPASKKALWMPAQQARFLVCVVDASQQCFLLPEEERRNIAQLALQVLHLTHVTMRIRQLAQLAGKMIAASPAVPWDPCMPELSIKL